MSVPGVDLDGLDFNDRTTIDVFNERLLRAQEATGLDFDDNNFADLFDKEDHLQKQLELLKAKVQRVEAQVEKMESTLSTRVEKRKREAAITNLTPEERAAYVEQQENEKEDQPNYDVIFEYMLLLGSTESDKFNDLSSTDFLKPHEGIRKKALQNELIKRQEKYSAIHFYSASNVLEPNPDGEGEIRHCKLRGNVKGQEFKLNFDVMEPANTLHNLVCEVDTEMQIEIGDVLEKIKKESNVLAFFEVFSHYGQILKERQRIFSQLISKYQDSPVNVEMLSNSRLKFEGSPNNNYYIIFEWISVSKNVDRQILNASTLENVAPVISLEAVLQPSALDKDPEDVLSKLNGKFLKLVTKVGAYKAVEIIIDKLFMPDLMDSQDLQESS